jgi:competence CoiA-like predicted nuclease
MEPKTKRTINEVLDCNTGECINVSEFFKKDPVDIFNYRSQLQKAIEGYEEPLYTCYYCKQKIRIRGGINSPHKTKAEIFHFAHLKDSEECPIKTKNKLTKDEVDKIKYNGVKESKLHITLKEQIAESLRRNQQNKKEVLSIEVEKIVKGKFEKEWRKPDIQVEFLGKKIAIELQLSTTWLDVITKRQHFYKENGDFILWVFNVFNTDDDSRKLTFDDVIYTNNQNAYIFDYDTYELSKQENDLVLKCYYKCYSRKENQLIENWEQSLIKLIDLKFDEENYRIYFHDAETQKFEIQKEIVEFNNKREKEKRKEILRKKRLAKKRDEIQQKIEILEVRIERIRNIMSKVEQKEGEIKRKIDEKIDFIENVSSNSDKIVKYFYTVISYSKPFYNNDKLLESFKEEFAEKLYSSSQLIATLNQENRTSNTNISWRVAMRKIDISGKIYSIIDPIINWNFIKQHYPKIQVINKKSINDLFAMDEMKSIRSELELSRFQYSKDTLFVIDFSPEIEGIKKKIKENQDIIDQQTIIIETIKKEIENKLIIHFQEEIKENKKVFDIYSNRLMKLHIELGENEKDLSRLKIAL